MRQLYKYNQAISEEERQMIQHLRDHFQEMLEDNGVNNLINSPD